MEIGNCFGIWKEGSNVKGGKVESCSRTKAKSVGEKELHCRNKRWGRAKNGEN